MSCSRRRGFRTRVGDSEQDQERGHRRQGGEYSKQAAPTECGNGQVRRSGCCYSPERSQHDQPAVGHSNAFGREPEDDRLEARHEGEGNAEADQGTADDEADQAIGQCEHKGADAGNQQQRALDGSGAVAVQQDTERKLGGGEQQEIHRRQHAEVGGAEAEIGGQIAGDQRVDRAEQVGEIVAGGEREKHAGDAAS